jgi:tetratricopeptide (TPR) repeat protein
MRFSTTMLLALLACTRAWAGDTDEAKRHAERGLAAYALSHYAEAAIEYEKAFSLKPDPALLYDAAQAHRLAGHRERALQLYENYLHVFNPDAKQREDVQHKIAELKAQESAPAAAKADAPPKTDATPKSTAAPGPAVEAAGPFSKAPVLKASIPHFEGTCPTVIEFNSTVFSTNSSPIKIGYRFTRSDHAHGPDLEMTLPAAGEHALPPFRWTVSGKPGRHFEAWVQLDVARPAAIQSAQEHFTVDCR